MALHAIERRAFEPGVLRRLVVQYIEDRALHRVERDELKRRPAMHPASVYVVVEIEGARPFRRNPGELEAGLGKNQRLRADGNRELFEDRLQIPVFGFVLQDGLAAVEPGMFGLAPAPAVRQALERAGWKLGDVDRFEINEAFSAIAIAAVRELGIPEEIVNVEGGAIAHGHPIGATGAVLVTRLLHSMRRDGLRRGVVTLCIGGGQGIALALEAI